MSYNRVQIAKDDIIELEFALRQAESKARYQGERHFRANMEVVAYFSDLLQDARIRLKKAREAVKSSQDWLNSYHGQQINLRRESYIGDDGLPF